VKIYTRKGDSGQTSLFGGQRVAKDNLRVEAYGTVDELNSSLGLAAALLSPEMDDWRATLVNIQADCFTLGAILASPKTGAAKPGHIPDLPEARVLALEAAIDALDDELEPLTSFILPGGSQAAAALHVARSVCRRAERRVVVLTEREDVASIVIKYLNRLSDFLFTLARAANARQGQPDVEWHPPSVT
jgi:cob(I)alamin adenosyltransferase